MDQEAPYVVVFDLETQSKISDMLGVDRYDMVCNLQISCVSFLKLKSERLFDPEDAQRAVDEAEITTLWRDVDADGRGPFAKLFDAFEHAEIIAAYNGLDFDFNVLHKHQTRLKNELYLSKALDPFSRLRAHTTLWYKLDALLKANGLQTKSSNGLEAIKMWISGRRDELQKYCSDDVRMLAKLLVLDELKLPNVKSTMPNYVFGLASAVSAARTSSKLSKKRSLDTATGVSKDLN